jgi:hypothetical protein
MFTHVDMIQGPMPETEKKRQSTRHAIIRVDMQVEDGPEVL